MEKHERLAPRLSGPYRPKYHFSPPYGWMNDPCGPVYFEGEYHLFYQWNPNGITWGLPSWGHAVSIDMIHWQDLPVALEPDDSGSIFSGTVVVDHNDTSGFFSGKAGLVAIYSCHGSGESQHIAYSSDRGRTWQKYSNNPVLPDRPGKEKWDFRDPRVFRYGPLGLWVMIVGGGQYRIYHSHDLLQWDFVSELGVFEEFPDLFSVPVEDESGVCKWVLSVAGYGYYIGEFDGYSFKAESSYRFADYGFSWQAAYVFNNMPDLRTVWIAWMRDGCKGPTETWRNNMSLPRELTLRRTPEGLVMAQRPVSEITALYRKHISLPSGDLIPGCNPLDGIHIGCFDLELEVEIEPGAEMVLWLRKGGNAGTAIRYNSRSNIVSVDTLYAGAPDMAGLEVSLLNQFFDARPVLAFARGYHAYYNPESKLLKLRVLVDECSVEVFVGEGNPVFSNTIYPPDDSCGLAVEVNRTGCRLVCCEVWELSSVPGLAVTNSTGEECSL